MKKIPSNPDSQWENLLDKARADTGPAINVAALLRAVRQAPVPTDEGWTGDFAVLFSSSRVVVGCLAGAAAFALVATWHVWDSLQAMPWIALLDTTTGGAS